MKISIRTAIIAIAALTIGFALSSCAVTTAPDGTKTKTVDQQAVNPWLELARDLFAKPSPPVAPIIVEPSK